MLRFNDIADRMLEYNPGVDLELLQRAYVFSAKVHEGQERLSGEPYLIHPLEVAGILVDLRVDDVTVAAGLLHDPLEDTLTTSEEIERLFGERVAFLVEGLTKIARIEFTSARERQAENFRKMLIAMSKDIRILLIKLADRLHNMRSRPARFASMISSTDATAASKSSFTTARSKKRMASSSRSARASL